MAGRDGGCGGQAAPGKALDATVERRLGLSELGVTGWAYCEINSLHCYAMRWLRNAELLIGVEV